MSKERYIEFDIAKGIAGYLVVLGHLLGQIAGKSIVLITYCHMPVFFWISGFVLRKSMAKYDGGDIWKLIRKKIRRLLIPYLVWSTVALVANVTVGMLHEDISLSDILKEFVSIFIYARSVWFLIVIFLTELLCIVIWSLAKINEIRYALVIGIWFLVCLSPILELLCIYKFKWLFPFMAFGMLCEEYAICEKLYNCFYLKICSLLFIPMAILMYREESFTEYLFCTYSNAENIVMGGIYYLISILAVILVIWISSFLKRVTIGGYIAEAGRYSLEIYVMHMFAVKFLPIVPSGIMGNDVFLYLYFSVYAMAVIVCIVLLSKYIFERVKILRWMVGK